jgi:hypothetical protein
MSTKTLGTPSDTNPWISPTYRAEDWRSLDLSHHDSSDWQTAVDIFYDRIYGRFLAPVQAISDHPDYRIRGFSGFVIIAIDCLLIETMYQFYKGIDETDIKHIDAFWYVFSTNPHFRSEFDSKNKSDIFYRHFRCGILHQAKTKKKSKIRVDRPKMVEQSNPRNIEEGLIIDRELFHQALISEINDYMARLQNPKGDIDIELREKFKGKMKTIVSMNS